MTDTMGSYAIAMGDIYEALRTAKRKTDEALEIYTSELAKQDHDLSLRETELAKRNIDVTKREHAVIKSELKLAVLDAELHYKKLEDAVAKPKDSGEGYITYRKEYVDYLMDVLGDFITRFENLNNPTWAEQLSHAVALLRKDSKVRVTDWEEYKFQWRNGRERLKSTKLQQTLRTEDGEESAKRCGRFQKLGDMGRPV